MTLLGNTPTIITIIISEVVWIQNCQNVLHKYPKAKGHEQVRKHWILSHNILYVLSWKYEYHHFQRTWRNEQHLSLIISVHWSSYRSIIEQTVIRFPGPPMMHGKGKDSLGKRRKFLHCCQMMTIAPDHSRKIHALIFRSASLSAALKGQYVHWRKNERWVQHQCTAQGYSKNITSQ